MRILVTNDDGVEAPGIAALARAATRTGHEVVVVAPQVDWSGASAAVGAYYQRDGVGYRTYEIDGLEDVPAYGVDGPPALGVILACIGGFGDRPDMVLSGINHGVNVGRSALHSGTIGAVLTAAQFGIRGLATSIRYGTEPVPWETPSRIAEALVPVLLEAPIATVLNLNVPNVEWDELRGLRVARLGRGGTIRSVTVDHDDADSSEPSNSETKDADNSDRARTTQATPATQGTRAVRATERTHAHSLPPGPKGTLRLDLAVPGSAGQETPAPGDPTDVDALLIGQNFATLTALVGVHEASDREVVTTAAAGAVARYISAGQPA